jgi:DNA helicase II / ATP-dependent DNA helicase PcrA
VPRNPTSQAAAIQRQHQAAHEPSAPVLLVAGPGSGKSATIEERVTHLVAQGVTPQEIFAISFTNASARDLSDRVRQALINAGITGADPSVSTLHSLALRSLRRGKLIQSYPSDPQVLDQWEIRRLIDEECVALHGGGLKRTRQIRNFHEALISTGSPNPPHYIPPTSPITAAEATAFEAFVRRRRQVYACVLPGEIVREAVTHIAAGLLDPVSLLDITHLIVDEFQDLNPVDIQFVDDLIAGDAIAFVCGDDDQSIYSFRHGSPKGMQEFPNTYGSCVSHTLQDCFRCTPAVLDAAQALISAYAMPQRLPKVHRSLYIGANPPVPGVVHRWRFNGGGPEATAIATSCAKLITSGLPPEEIMILLSNQAIQAPMLYDALDAAGVPYRRAREDSVLDTNEGRLCLAALRVVCNPDDYVAQRVLLGLQSGVGTKTCADIADRALLGIVATVHLFAAQLPAGVFTSRQANALTTVAELVSLLAPIQDSDALSCAGAAIESALIAYAGSAVSTAWNTITSAVPVGIIMRELRDYVWSDNDEQQGRILAGVYLRLGQPQPASTVLAPRVRVMSMHGAKGLSAGVVFIPGLEEELLPGPFAARTGGGVYEAARLLYVALTRAKAACVVSCAGRRGVQGKTVTHRPSQFAARLAGTFRARTTGLTPLEAADVTRMWNLL